MKVLLADDHPVFREGMATVLASLPDVELVGEAEDGAAAVRLVGELQPDVVVMDLHMPEVNGIEATRRIVTDHPAVAVLVLTMLEADESVAAAVRAGARGYVLKGSGRPVIEAALRAVASGASYLAPGIALAALGSPHRKSVGHPAFPELTDRDHDVLTLVAAGLSNAAICARLHLSDKTVRNYVSGLISKLGVSDRAALVALARDRGLGGSSR